MHFSPPTNGSSFVSEAGLLKSDRKSDNMFGLVARCQADATAADKRHDCQATTPQLRLGDP